MIEKTELKPCDIYYAIKNAKNGDKLSILLLRDLAQKMEIAPENYDEFIEQCRSESQAFMQKQQEEYMSKK